MRKPAVQQTSSAKQMIEYEFTQRKKKRKIKERIETHRCGKTGEN